MTHRSTVLLIALALVCWRIVAPESLGQNPPQPAAASGFTGAGSCSSSSCHGGVWPRTATDKIQQNEYQTWSTRDKHAKAYAVLLEPRSKSIAKNLRIDRAETSKVCLDCHAVNAPAGQRAATFDISDGVSCEGCHGAASGWLGPHTLQGWKHEQSLAAGMVDMKGPAKAAATCLGCHVGNDQKTVDHELIAAGHPDLIFEFETFTALMPAHWRTDPNAEAAVRRWGTSQVLTMRESMKQLARRAGGKAWDGLPEFADFECSTCHHDLVTPSSRQERGFAGKAGALLWDESHYVVLRHFVEAVNPQQRRTLDASIGTLRGLMQSPASNRMAVAEAATRIATQMDALLPLVDSAAAQVPSAALMRAVTGDANEISAGGAHAAAQAAMAADVFYRAGQAKTPAVNDQINVVYGLLKSQSRYDAGRFAAELRRLGTLTR